jgi:hypothetical protein
MKKQTQPPTNVEGVDWVVLNLKALLIKKNSNINLLPSWMWVKPLLIGTQSVVHISYTFWFHVNIHSFIFYHLDALLGFSLM